MSAAQSQGDSPDRTARGTRDRHSGVTVFRDLPSEGWPSMEVYADGLLAAHQASGAAVTSYVPRQPRISGRAGRALTYLWRMAVYPALAGRHQGQVNHIIDHSYGHLVNALNARRTVVTCHDIAPLLFPAQHIGHGLSARFWRTALRGTLRAAAIITDSEATRDDLLRCTTYPPEQIFVAPISIDHAAFYPRERAEQETVRAHYNLPRNSLVLHVGHCGARKNIEALLTAFAGLRGRGYTATLVQAGGTFSAGQRQSIERLDIGPFVRQIPFIDAAHLPALYSLAGVLALPSWYEGFGLPVLEAMACGTPVVAARAGSVPEVAGEAALLVDPAEPDQLAEALALLLTDAERHANLAERGRQQAARFSWERCARETRAVYDLVAARAAGGT